MVQPGADLRDHLVRQEARGAGGVVGRDAVGDPVEKRAREHVAGAGQILRLARKRGNVRLDAAMADVGAVRAVGHHD